MAQVTTLSLAGGPRFAPFLVPVEAPIGDARPDVGTVTQLSLLAAPRPGAGFADKPEAGSDSRPDGLFTQLGLVGAPRPPQTFLAKTPAVGISGRVTLSLTPSATMQYGRRYTVFPDVSVGVRPSGAVITVAHRNILHGTNRVDIAVNAAMRFTRSGAHHFLTGNAGLSIGVFGFVRVQRRRGIVGSVTTTISTATVMRYTPAPVKHYVQQGGAKLSLTPSSAMGFFAGGFDYGMQGNAGFTVTPSGRVTVVRETTYRMHGNVTLSITPRGTVTKTTGAPQNYAIQGSVTLSITPNAVMGLLVGVVNNYHIQGNVRLTLTANGKSTPLPAVPLDSDGALLLTQPRTRRQLKRVFR